MSDCDVPFHLAFPVTDLEATRRFYCDLLGCRIGREADRWVDFDFCGHQLSAHLVDEGAADLVTNSVDGDAVPVRHFGLVLPWERWEGLVARLTEHGARFLLAPRIRFEGKVGQQGTFFLQDPSGNALEFKSFKDPAQLFASKP